MSALVNLEGYSELRVWAEMFFDAQLSRIRAENRVRSAPVFPEPFAPELAAAKDAEHRIRLVLRRQYRRTAPQGVVAWQKGSPGIGEDLLARLLGHLGHPRIAQPSHWEGEGAERKLVPDVPFERSVGQLWQYCGHGRPARMHKGMSAAELAARGRPMCKMLVHLVAECAIKEPGRTLPPGATTLTAPNTEAPRGDPSDTAAEARLHAPSKVEAPTWPYRAVYEHRRLVTADRVHAEPCARCGPAGSPAVVGSAWSKAHQHADALRIVGKAILRDLWVAAGADQ